MVVMGRSGSDSLDWGYAVARKRCDWVMAGLKRNLMSKRQVHSRFCSRYISVVH